MLYAILCYDSEDVVGAWTKEEDDAVMARLGAVQEKLAAEGRLGPVARLLPTTAATTIRKGREPLVIDGPFAETKEQLLGFYVVDVREPRGGDRGGPGPRAGQRLGRRLRASPARLFQRRERGGMTDLAWIDAALTGARPQALGALLRYFRDLDLAEEAFQDACLRALRTWPRNGPPRDPAAWLIFVGRNAAIDQVRRRGTAGGAAGRGADLGPRRCRRTPSSSGSTARITATTCCGSCSSAAIRTCRRPSRSRSRCASCPACRCRRSPARSWSARAAMEQRITRAKSRIAAAGVPFETPGAVGAGRAARRRRRHGLPRLQRGLFGERRRGARRARRSARRRSGSRACCCGCSRREPEIMGLAALLLLQHARAPARFDADGSIVLLEDQDRSLWNRTMIAEGLALIDKAMRHRRPGPYQVQAAIAALHARAARPEETDWAEIDLLYGALERLQPSPVVTLNRAVAVAKVRGPEAALAMIEPLAPRLSGYFHFFGVKGALLLQLGRPEEARVAFDQAIALARTAAEAAHIRLHLDRLMQRRCAGRAPRAAA